MSKFILGQIGVRNFSAARLLYNRGLLDQLIVDTYFERDSFYAKIPVWGDKLALKLKKYDVGLPADLVSYDWAGALTMRVLKKYTSNINAYTFANRRLGKRLISYAENKSPGSYYGFDTSSMEFLEWGTQRGWDGYLEQCVAPRNSQIAMWHMFSDKYGIDSQKEIEQCLVQQERERVEWSYAKKILVPSTYVKDELLKDGNLNADKIYVVNYGYTPTGDKKMIRQAIEAKQMVQDKKINLLFAGNTGYRKGIADIIKLAEDLKTENIKFLIAGNLEEEAKQLIANHKIDNIVYLGKLSKEDLEAQYLAADVFFFPSYLEGSAMVLLEAMSWGLPIITTFESGSVVEDGVNGLICKAGELEKLKSNILKLTYNADLRFNMGIKSLEQSTNYSVDEYGKKLLDVLTQ